MVLLHKFLHSGGIRLVATCRPVCPINVIGLINITQDYVYLHSEVCNESVFFAKGLLCMMGKVILCLLLTVAGEFTSANFPLFIID